MVQPFLQKCFGKNKVEIPLKQAEENKSYYITTLNEEAQAFFEKLNINIPHFIQIIERLQDGSIILKEDNGQVSVIPQFYKKNLTNAKNWNRCFCFRKRKHLDIFSYINSNIKNNVEYSST